MEMRIPQLQYENKQLSSNYFLSVLKHVQEA